MAAAVLCRENYRDLIHPPSTSNLTLRPLLLRERGPSHITTSLPDMSPFIPWMLGPVVAE
ncbi:hypothetical protein CC2G_001292 [Coprinopsis cinerea AmutBmut pab1-1]|nr:hypothetical protein CC2G_001292 [Coprinopsis cinerea AmutBmut pab1-1]